MIKALRRLTQLIESTPDSAAALQLLSAQLQQILHCDEASVYVINAERGEYLLAGNSDADKHSLVGKVRIPFGKGLIGQVAERDEPLNISDQTAHPSNVRHPDLPENDFHGFIAVPIVEHGELFGVAVAQRKQKVAFSEEEVSFLVTVMVQLGGYVEQAIDTGLVSQLVGKRKSAQAKWLHGIAGAPGVSLGQGVVVYPPADFGAVPDKSAKNCAAEIDAFKMALNQARDDIERLQSQARDSLSVTEQVLFDAYLKILDSRTLMEEVVEEITDNQVWAQTALRRVIKQHVAQFENMEDPYLKERAADFRDLGLRILSKLQHTEQKKIDYPEKTILVSEEITATALMEVPPGRLVGVVSSTGSRNSHVAILTRALGVPSVMSVTGQPIAGFHEKSLIVDGYNGDVYLSPTAALKKEFQNLADEESALDASLEAIKDLPAETSDGHRVSLLMNTGLQIGMAQSLTGGAEGVGLYRTEMLFMLKETFPSEEEQSSVYHQLLKTFAPKPVTVRTLDIGGDKSLPYFHIEEENPFLGWRGIRVTLDQTPLFLQQLRAMLKASVGCGNLKIMLPMVSSVTEVDEAKRYFLQAYDELIEEGLDIEKPELGIMIEVPAAVYQAKELARRVDFLSVGSNDLIQYMLAVDRNNARVADLYESYHPAVLRALHYVVQSGHKANVPVSICGEMAGDPISIVLLLAMGYDSLSMNARALPRSKWLIRQFSLEKAKQLLKEVLVMDEAREVREHMEAALVEAGLGGLIRAGN